MFPRINIDLEKMYDNVVKFKKMCSKEDINLMAVTKSFCADKKIAETQVKAGVKYLADSRIQNLKKLRDLKAPKVLIRIPMQSELKKVIKYADISFHSELSTLERLNELADKKQKVLLMLDLGDLREGILPENIESFVSKVQSLENIKIIGFGVNLTCYGGIIPSPNNLGKLEEISLNMAERFNLDLELISGGNSSSLFLLNEDKMPKNINNLRLGEAIVLGRETAYGNLVDDTHQDIFTLEAEIVELKTKGSLPIGEVGMDAFGNKPTFKDQGEILRGIVAIGQQDVNPDGLTPFNPEISILGASSDHLILNLEKTDKSYKVGDTIKFKVDYGALLKLTTSEYVDRNYVGS
ncbi:MAG: ornithine racemase Orr [Bacillota bacterium]